MDVFHTNGLSSLSECDHERFQAPTTLRKFVYRARAEFELMGAASGIAWVNPGASPPWARAIASSASLMRWAASSIFCGASTPAPLGFPPSCVGVRKLVICSTHKNQNADPLSYLLLRSNRVKLMRYRDWTFGSVGPQWSLCLMKHVGGIRGPIRRSADGRRRRQGMRYQFKNTHHAEFRSKGPLNFRFPGASKTSKKPPR